MMSQLYFTSYMWSYTPCLPALSTYLGYIQSSSHSVLVYGA